MLEILRDHALGAIVELSILGLAAVALHSLTAYFRSVIRQELDNYFAPIKKELAEHKTQLDGHEALLGQPMSFAAAKVKKPE